MAGVAGFALAAPLLVVINGDIAPSANMSWVYRRIKQVKQLRLISLVY